MRAHARAGRACRNATLAAHGGRIRVAFGNLTRRSGAVVQRRGSCRATTRRRCRRRRPTSAGSMPTRRSWRRRAFAPLSPSCVCARDGAGHTRACCNTCRLQHAPVATRAGCIAPSCRRVRTAARTCRRSARRSWSAPSPTGVRRYPSGIVAGLSGIGAGLSAIGAGLSGIGAGLSGDGPALESTAVGTEGPWSPLPGALSTGQ